MVELRSVAAVARVRFPLGTPTVKQSPTATVLFFVVYWKEERNFRHDIIQDMTERSFKYKPKLIL